MMCVRCGLLAFAVIIACDFAPRARPEPTQQVAAADTLCSVQTGGALARDLVETSGLAFGTDDRVWTHNDGQQPLLYALDRTGRVVQRVRIDGITLGDWEDLESGPCASGTCLYIADTGDNGGRRRDVAIHVVPEPARGVSTVRATSTRQLRYPDGAQDAEALFALPGGELFIVTKGRQRAIELYRVPAAQPGSAVTVLEHVRQLAVQPADSLDRVSAATATPDGKWIAVRTYRVMLLYPAQPLISNQPLEPLRVDLTPLRHIQGEAVAIDTAGNAFFTSEDESGVAPMWGSMKCMIPK